MIDPLRHMSVFSPDKWGARRVDVIGAGATGCTGAAVVGGAAAPAVPEDRAPPSNTPARTTGATIFCNMWDSFWAGLPGRIARRHGGSMVEV